MSKSDTGRSSAKNKAVALRYRTEEDMAPVVIASGYGTIADKIIGIAEEKGIPVFKDDSAASMLCMLEVGRNIPPELYEVIAAIYMQILKVSSNIKQSTQDTKEDAVDADDIRKRLAAGRRQSAGSSSLKTGLNTINKG